jgi:hypothetical protein
MLMVDQVTGLGSSHASQRAELRRAIASAVLPYLLWGVKFPALSCGVGRELEFLRGRRLLGQQDSVIPFRCTN